MDWLSKNLRMSQIKICYQSIGRFPIFKVKGKLKFSTLSCLSILTQHYSEQVTEAVVVDLSNDRTITSEIEKLQEVKRHLTMVKAGRPL